MSNRKTILVDLDNCVYDWVAAMAGWLRDNGAAQGKSHGMMMRAYKTWEVWEDWGIPKGEFIRWWRLGIEAEEIYAKGPLIRGAREALWKLSDAEWDIHIATNRLTKFGLHDKIVENTVSWLRDNNIPYRQLSFVSNKHRIIVDAIVDDNEDNIDWSGEYHGQAFLFPANHNANKFIDRNAQYFAVPASPLSAWKNIVKDLIE